MPNPPDKTMTPVQMVSKEEQAKKEWEAKANIYGVPDHPYCEGFMDAIDLYQSALKRDIEAEIKALESILDRHKDMPRTESALATFKKVLKLLTTIIPDK